MYDGEIVTVLTPGMSVERYRLIQIVPFQLNCLDSQLNRAIGESYRTTRSSVWKETRNMYTSLERQAISGWKRLKIGKSGENGNTAIGVLRSLNSFVQPLGRHSSIS
jgi:hypothetical protein